MVISLKKEGFSLGEVEAILGNMFRIDATKRSTFAARLQQIQRMGVPRGANPGRGVRFRYTAWQLAEFALLVDLLDAGIPPNLLKTHFAETGFYTALGQGQAVERAGVTAKDGLHLFIEFHVLDYLRTADPDATSEHVTDQKLKTSKGLGWLDRDDAVTPTIAINLSKRLADLRAAIEAVMPGHVEGLLFPPEPPRPGMIA